MSHLKTSSNKGISSDSVQVKGELVPLDNENYYKISNSDTMRPFFMSIVSPEFLFFILFSPTN